MIKTQFTTSWHNLCFGIFWDPTFKALYIFPFPTIGLKIFDTATHHTANGAEVTNSTSHLSVVPSLAHEYHVKDGDGS